MMLSNMMVGILFGLGGGIFNALDNATMRGSTHDPLIFAWGKIILATFFSLMLVIITGFVITDTRFWYMLVIATIIDGIAAIYYVKALQTGLAHTVPMLSITPIIILFTGFLFLHETPHIISALGVFAIVIGVYALNIARFKEGYLEPFKALLKEPGSRIMLLIAIVYGINAPVFRLGFAYSSVFTFMFAIAVTESLFFSLLILLYKKPWRTIFTKKRLVLASSAFVAIGNVMTSISMTMIQTSYAIALKRTSILFSVLLGMFIFKEAKNKATFLGSVIILAGVIMITYFG